MTPEDRAESCDAIPERPDEALRMMAVALAGIRYDLAAIATELRELRYSVERGR